MSRKPLVDVDEIMAHVPNWKPNINGISVVSSSDMRAVLEDVVAKYEAALDGARKKATFCEAMRDEIMALREENDELRKRTTATLQTGLEPEPGFFNAENMDYLNKMVHEHKERIADLEAQNLRRDKTLDEIQCMSQHDLEKQYQVLVDTGKYTRFQIAIHLARFAEARCLTMYRQSGNEDLDVTHRRIDKLSDRVLELEREQREGQGEL